MTYIVWLAVITVIATESNLLGFDISFKLGHHEITDLIILLAASNDGYNVLFLALDSIYTINFCSLARSLYFMLASLHCALYSGGWPPRPTDICEQTHT
jgi:hypothetical protein